MSKGDEGREVMMNNAAARREQMFDTYRELIGLGETPLSACSRMKVSPSNLSRTAYRWKAYDIATPLAAYVAQDKEKRRR